MDGDNASNQKYQGKQSGRSLLLLDGVEDRRKVALTCANTFVVSLDAVGFPRSESNLLRTVCGPLRGRKMFGAVGAGRSWSPATLAQDTGCVGQGGR